MIDLTNPKTFAKLGLIFAILALPWQFSLAQAPNSVLSDGPEKAVVVKSTTNPTGLQVGVAHPAAGALPEGTEELAKEGAMASADLDWKKARVAYQKMVEIAPDNAMALSNLGAVEFRLSSQPDVTPEVRRRHLVKAGQLLERATRVEPSIAQNWITLGLIHYEQDQLMPAVSALSRAVHEDKGDPRSHNVLGVVIRDLGWIVGAETELLRAISLDPTYADAHYNLAVMYLDRAPPSVELARRHYYAALDHGAKPDKSIEQKLNPQPIEPTEPAE